MIRKTSPTTRVSRNQTKVVRAAPIRRYRPPYENCTTRLPVALNPSRRVVREADATLPRSRLQCARRTSMIYHRSRHAPQSTVVPEWSNWQRARQVWEVVSRPKGKVVLGTKTIFKRKIGKDGRIEKYKCRFVAQVFRQIKGIHYDESSSPTPSQASIRMVLGTAAVKDGELRQLDVNMAYLEANVKEELYIELPEDYRNSCDQVGRLQKVMYGLLHAGLLWLKKFSTELAATG